MIIQMKSDVTFIVTVIIGFLERMETGTSSDRLPTCENVYKLELPEAPWESNTAQLSCFVPFRLCPVSIQKTADLSQPETHFVGLESMILVYHH